MSRADSEDCAQEVWTHIVSRLARLDYDPRQGRFCCWIFRLIRNRVTDFARGLARVPTVNIHGLESTLCCRDLDPAAAYERSRRRRIVREALAVLEARISPTNYRILHLRWIEGRSISEVAARLDLTPEQVSRRHYGVKQKLRRLLRTHGGTEG